MNLPGVCLFYRRKMTVKKMTETELKEKQISERVTALEHDVRTVGETLESHRTETRAAFESIQKRSDENFGQVWRSQERLSSDIAGLVSKLQNDTEAISEKMAASRQVNWPLLVAGAGLMTAVIGLVAAGMQQYVRATIDPVERQQVRDTEFQRSMTEADRMHEHEKQLLRDQLQQYRTAAMIAEAVAANQGGFDNADAKK